MPWINAHGEQAMADALKNTEDAYQASLAMGNNLQSLTEQAQRRGAELEAGRRAAWSMEAGVARDGARYSPRRFRWAEVWDERRLGRRWRLVELVQPAFFLD